MAVDMIGVNNKKVNSARVDVNNQNPKPDEKKPVSKAVIGGALIGLAALASVGVYLATRGKGNVKPKDLNNDNITQKFENIINEFKSKNKEFANVEPTVTTLKNGKTKIEFKRYNETKGCNENNMVLLNKDGQKDKTVKFFDYGDSLKQYFVYDGADGRCLKTYNSVRREGVEEGFNIKQHKIKIKKDANNSPEGTYWKQDIETTRSDNYIHVEKGQEYIPYKESKGKTIHTTAHIGSDKKPDMVKQSVLPNTADEEKITYVFKPAKNPVKTETKKDPFINPKIYTSLDEIKDESFIMRGVDLFNK